MVTATLCRPMPASITSANSITDQNVDSQGNLGGYGFKCVELNEYTPDALHIGHSGWVTSLATSLEKSVKQHWSYISC
jgi:hypothetical protein